MQEIRREYVYGYTCYVIISNRTVYFTLLPSCVLCSLALALELARFMIYMHLTDSI